MRLLAIMAMLVAYGVALGAPVLDGAHVTETVLDNGLRVVVKEEPYWNMAALCFCIKASALYEGENHGIADIVRYMICEVGTEPPSADTAAVGERAKESVPIGAFIEDLGGVFTSYTSSDATVITAVMSVPCLLEVFPRLVRVIMEPQFREELWARQLQIIRRSLEDAEARPERKLFHALWSTAFQEHPYGWPVSGTPKGIMEFNAQDLADFHKACYVPNNMALIVAGDVKAETMFALAREHFARYPRAELKVPPVKPEPEQTGVRKTLNKAATEHTLVGYGWRAAGIDKKRDVCTLDVIYALLGEGEHARLPRALSDREKVVEGPKVEFITKRDPGLFIIYWKCQPAAEYETGAAVLAEVEKLRSEPVSESELAEAKELIRAGYSFDNQALAEQTGSMAFYEAIDGYRFAIDYLDEVARVTAADVQRVAKQYLGPSNHTLAIVRPRTDGGPIREAQAAP